MLFVLTSILTWISSSAIMFGGVVPYIPQYLDIKRTENADGFSLYVCLILLIANTLRILFWFGHWFELPLLIQSIVMNITMLLVISLCVSVKTKGQLAGGTHSKHEHVFTDFDFEHFWEWTDTQSYFEFMLTFSTVGCVLLYFCIDSAVFVESLGSLAVATEAMLGVPQFYRNLASKSTFGMSRKMVLMWLSGDTFKTVYFYVREVPLQFLIFGCLQIVIDASILSQCYVYRKRNATLSTWIVPAKD